MFRSFFKTYEINMNLFLAVHSYICLHYSVLLLYLEFLWKMMILRRNVPQTVMELHEVRLGEVHLRLRAEVILRAAF